jgi:hypothetical protein
VKENEEAVPDSDTKATLDVLATPSAEKPVNHYKTMSELTAHSKTIFHRTSAERPYEKSVQKVL